tara:strand:+ start:854 stop:1129 length:276 start_codon:yes stop_codon:yes gene_type:complete
MKYLIKKIKCIYLYMVMKNLFTKHPHSVGETYFEHMCCAFKFHCTLLKLSIAALVHAIFPFLCETTASDGVKKLNKCMRKRNDGKKDYNMV